MRLSAIIAALILMLTACGSESAPTAQDEAGVVQTTAATTTTTAPATTMAEMAEMADDVDHDEAEAGHEEAEADHQEEAAVADREMAIIMTEFAFEPAAVTVSAGETIRFIVSNEGAIEHEFRLTTEHAAQEHIEAGHEGHDDDAATSDHGHEEILLLVQPGETAEIIATFHDAEEFDVIACLLPGHYEAGMLAGLTVE